MRKFTFLFAVFFILAFTANAQWHPQGNKSKGSNPDNIANPADWKKTAQQFSAAEMRKHELSGPKSFVWKWDTIISYDTLGFSNRFIQTFDINGNVLTKTKEQWQTSTWEITERNNYSYDANGNMLTDLCEWWSGSTWDNIYRCTNTYDLNGNLLTETWESWQTSSWVNENRYTYTYDGSGHQLTYFYENWVTNTWEAVYRNTYTYDVNGYQQTWLGEEWLTNTWVNSEKGTYTYDGSLNLISVLSEYWQTNTWLNDERHTMTYDGSGNRLTYLEEYWQPAGWVNSERGTYTYDGSGNMLTQIVEVWQTPTWQDDKKFTYTYDADGNSITGKFESIIGSNWHPSIYYIPVYSQKEYVIEVDEAYRFVASFVSFSSPTGFENIYVENNSFSIFPNPASDMVNLNIANSNNTNLALNIYNTIGALVKSVILSQNQQQINIGDLSNGVYVVEVKSKDYTEKQKLIIQR